MDVKLVADAKQCWSLTRDRRRQLQTTARWRWATKVWMMTRRMTVVVSLVMGLDVRLSWSRRQGLSWRWAVQRHVLLMVGLRHRRIIRVILRSLSWRLKVRLRLRLP